MSTVLPNIQSVSAGQNQAPPSPNSSSSVGRLTSADLADPNAKPGDSVQILLGGNAFTIGMNASVFGQTVPVQVSSSQAASIYVTLPNNYDPKLSYSVTLSSGQSIQTYHLETHYIPSGADLAAQLKDSKQERKNLEKYAKSAQELASARIQAAIAQRRLALAQNPAALDVVNPASVPSQSAYNPSCRPDNPTELAYVRVRRSVMDPKEASDAFGRRLGRHFIVFQVTVENNNTDYQYMLHDVSVDLSRLMNAPAGTYEWAFSTQELSMLRGVPEKGQDYDPRNLTFHIMRGVGSVAGGVTGLTADSIQDIFGSAVAAFNGPLLSSFLDIFPDHTATQLNRLSDSAFTSNSLVPKQGAKVFAIFVPTSLVLTNKESNNYWENPHKLLADPEHDFRNADVCVDGAFITEVPSLALSKIAFADPTTIKAGATADILLAGTNLVAGDTMLNLFGQNVALSSIDSANANAKATITVPASYDFLREYPAYIYSAKSGQKSVSVNLPPLPVPAFKSVSFADLTKVHKGQAATVQITGLRIVPGDTTLFLFGSDSSLANISADSTSAQATVTVPNDYDPAKPSPATLKTKSGLNSNSITLLGIAPTLTTAKSSTKAADGTVTITLTGTGLSTSDMNAAFDFGIPLPLSTVTADATSGTVTITPPADWPGSHTATLQSATRGNSSAVPITQ
jgi:hypothetical protein